MVKLVNFVMCFLPPPPPHTHTHTRARVHAHTHTHTHTILKEEKKKLLGPHHDLGLEQAVELEVTIV